MKDLESGDSMPVEDWIQYKRDKTVAFVKQGYCVEWLPSVNHWITVYRPGCPFDEIPELRATAKFYVAPSKYGNRWWPRIQVGDSGVDIHLG